ncbi:MAG: flagellar basal body-associated FliL family protein [Spartobacteria bacterium]|nr:flagellar basal body-associated FliL family protein [Spartobacteria bacterium]
MADEGKSEGINELVPDPSSAAAPAKGKSGTLIVVIVGFVIMIVTPLTTYFVVKATVPPPLSTSAPREELDAKPGETTTFNLGTIYVNIAETKGTRVLKIEPYLVLSEPRLDEVLTGMAPMLRDKVLAAASTKTIDELEGSQGRENLKRSIMTLINTAIKGRMSGAVVDVYFNEFLIQ